MRTVARVTNWVFPYPVDVLTCTYYTYRTEYMYQPSGSKAEFASLLQAYAVGVIKYPRAHTARPCPPPNRLLQYKQTPLLLDLSALPLPSPSPLSPLPSPPLYSFLTIPTAPTE